MSVIRPVSNTRARRALLLLGSVAALVFAVMNYWNPGAILTAIVAALVSAEGPTGTYVLASGVGQGKFLRFWTLHGWTCVAALLVTIVVVNHTPPSDAVNGVMLLGGLSLLSFHGAVTIYAIAVIFRRSARSLERWVAGELLVASAVMLVVVFVEEA